MSKHTPGPWQLMGPFLKPYPQSGEEREVKLNGPTRENGWATYLGSIVWNDTDAEKAARFQANARLIAAAPDMLDALEMVDCKCTIAERENGHLLDCFMPVVQATIAKAKGEKT